VRIQVPTHTWVTIPGTTVQVRHEAGGLTWCEITDAEPFGVPALTVSNPEAHWSTRPLPAAQKADLGGFAVELDPSSPQAAVRSWREAQDGGT
jgi:hypothetical protein